MLGLVGEVLGPGSIYKLVESDTWSLVFVPAFHLFLSRGRAQIAPSLAVRDREGVGFDVDPTT